MTEVVLENLSKHYGSVRAVDNVNLKIGSGLFLVLLGPSGCGKTTTLRLIAGLEKPTTGSIYFNGRKVNDLEPRERNVAMVFQDYALYPHMKVYDNIALCLKVRKLPRDEIDRRVKETAKLLRIEHLLDRMPGQLSGGEQQRVALGRAIVREPSVFLMDEPLSNLDAALRVQMRAELKKLHEKLRTTTIYVTHDQAEAMVMAETIAVMNDGRILQVGTPSEIYDHPKNRFVAEFIGSPRINIMNASFLERPTGYFLDTGAFRLRVDEEAAGILKDFPSELLIGIRPEDVYVTDRATEETARGRIYLVENVGSIAYVTVDVDGILLKVQVPKDFSKGEGEEVLLAFNKKKLYVFDGRSGEAII